MKAVILAGGLGTRISEETHLKPKPMIEIGGKPILWHIMKIYSTYGINEFIICLGYKGYVIKEFFANYFLHTSDVTFDMSNNSMIIHQQKAEAWKVTLIDTGEHTMTGGRLKRVSAYLSENETFCFTYGDGLSDINITELVNHHNSLKSIATVTVVQPPGRYGSVDLNEYNVKGFIEKPKGDGGWINGGFFVLNKKVLDYIEGDDTPWESDPLEKIATIGELNAFIHQGFWRPMDTLRDKIELEGLWSDGKAPWKIWI
jgi:glucose-1-phosphate cytidylyltransferase